MAVERTLSIVKPDAVGKNVIGEIYSRFEQNGLRLVAAQPDRFQRVVTANTFLPAGQTPNEAFTQWRDFCLTVPDLDGVHELGIRLLTNSWVSKSQ